MDQKKRYCALSFSGTSPFCSHIQRHLSYFFKYWHLKNRNKTRERNGIKHWFLLRHKNHDAGILGPVLSINGPEYYYLLIANYSFCFQSSARLINSEVRNRQKRFLEIKFDILRLFSILIFTRALRHSVIVSSTRRFLLSRETSWEWKFWIIIDLGTKGSSDSFHHCRLVAIQV